MLLTEIKKYNYKENFFIEEWKKCKWVLWDECPQSIFLVSDSFREKKPNEKAIRKYGRFIPTHHFCLELDWRGGFIKYPMWGFPCVNRKMAGIDDDFEFDELISELYEELLNGEMSNPKRGKIINELRSNKKRKRDPEFTPHRLSGNSRIYKLEDFLESNNYTTF